MLVYELEEFNEFIISYDKIQNNIKKVYDLIFNKNQLNEENKLLKKLWF